MVEGGSIPDQPNAYVTVVAVDDAGRRVASQETADAFHLAVHGERRYCPMVSRDGRDVGVLTWGDDERPDFVSRGARSISGTSA